MYHRIYPLFTPFLALLLGCLAAFAAQANSLEGLRVSQGQGEAQVVRLDFQAPLGSDPMHFTTANPHRIVLNLADTTNALGRANETLDAGVLRGYHVVQSGERTRVVLDLASAAGYELRREGKTLLVIVRGQAPVPAAVAAATPPVKAGHSIRNIDFRRGANGEGRVEVKLSAVGSGVDIKQKGQAIQVDFLDTSLPKTLQRRLDVGDYATPAQTIEAMQQGNTTRMTIQPKGKWDYFAYQSGDTFIVEISSLEQLTSANQARTRYSGEKLSLNFHDEDVRALLKVIAEFTGLNIVASETVQGKITLRLVDVPWDQALDIILRTKGLGKRENGNVIWVAPQQELDDKDKQDMEAKQKLADIEELQTEVIRLNYIRAPDASAILLGKSITTAEAGSAVNCSSTAVGVGGKTDTATGAAQGGGAGASNSMLSKRGTVNFDLKTNSLFVQDTPSRLEKIRQLIPQLDTPARQLLIEARVVVATDTFGRTLGARLGLKAQLPHGAGISSGSNDAAAIAWGGLGAGSTVPFNVDLPASTLGPSNPTLGFSIIEGAGNAILGLELQALEADRRGKVLSNPRVITQNQRPAVILQGQQIPYVTVSQGTGTTTVTVGYKDAFLCLLVDPQVLNNDEIILDVEVQKDAPGTQLTLPGGSTAFPVDTKRVKTQVRVKNGDTAVLGGIFEQTIADETNKVPLLGDIPVLGALFRDNYKRDTKTELLIFLTPRLLDQNLRVQ